MGVIKIAKKIRNISIDNISKRIRQMVKRREKFIKDGIEKIHVILQPGNSKTGKNCWTASLIPGADCRNCKYCVKECYDLLNVCFQPNVQNDRARNSAIHKVDIKRYWSDIDEEIKAKGVTELRINVGGDLVYEDFNYIRDLAIDNSECDMLFFTKTYDDLNQYISENINTYPDNYGFPENVSPLMSRWPNTSCDNPYGVPESHVLYVDGSTTAPLSDELKQMVATLVTTKETEGRMELLLSIIVKMRDEGLYYCGGNCSECHFNKEGCWALGKWQHVIFPAH